MDTFGGELSSEQLAAIVSRAEHGVVVIDHEYRVVYWNRFMHAHSGMAPADVLTRDVFACFPELPREWLVRKVRAVTVLGNSAYSQLSERPYLFRLQHNRPITGGIDSMRQDCVFSPIPGPPGQPPLVCITVFDATDAAIYDARLREAMTALEELGETDVLTGLHNRRYLEGKMLEERTRSARYGTVVSLVIIDIDHFKRVNDTLGHLAGDEVLRQVASRIQSHVRACDTVARYGGEEFVLVLPETEENGAKVVASRLLQAVRQTPVTYGEIPVAVTISAGVCQWVDMAMEQSAAIERADRALYCAKEQGRDRVVCASEIPAESGQ